MRPDVEFSVFGTVRVAIIDGTCDGKQMSLNDTSRYLRPRSVGGNMVLYITSLLS